MPQSKFSSDSLPSLTGKVYLVTGGNSGIGKTTVIGLASHGATVYMGARNESKARLVIQEITKELPDADIRYIHLNLSDLKSVIETAKDLRNKEAGLNGLINNAGIMGVPFEKTVDGYDVQFQTNYLSHWLLTYHLLPLLLSTAASAGPGSARVVGVTSDGHAAFPPKEGIKFDDINLESSNAMTRYGQSKLANVLHIKELHKRYGPHGSQQASAGIWFSAVHPGHIDTDLNKQATGTAPAIILRTLTPIMRCLGILDDQAKGALSSLFAVASEVFDGNDSGCYIVPYAKISEPSPLAKDPELAKNLWKYTENELERKGFLIDLI